MKSLIIALIAVACVATTASAQVTRDRSGATHIGKNTLCFYQVNGRWADEAVSGDDFYRAVYNFQQTLGAQRPDSCSTARIKGIWDSGNVYGKFGNNRVNVVAKAQDYDQVEKGAWRNCVHFTCLPSKNDIP